MKTQVLNITQIISHEQLNASGKTKADGNPFKEGHTRVRVLCDNFQRGDAPTGGLAKLRGLSSSEVSAFMTLPTEAVEFLGLKEGDDLNSYADKIGNEVSIKVTEVTASQYEAMEDKSGFKPRNRYADESKDPNNLIPLTHGGEQVYWKREILDGTAESVGSTLLQIDKAPVAETVKA